MNISLLNNRIRSWEIWCGWWLYGEFVLFDGHQDHSRNKLY